MLKSLLTSKKGFMKVLYSCLSLFSLFLFSFPLFSPPPSPYLSLDLNEISDMLCNKILVTSSHLPK